QRAHLLGLQVIRVVVARAQGIRPQHDAALHLRAKPLLPGEHVLLDQVAGSLGLISVSHAVVAGQVGAGFGRRDDVVGGQRHVAAREADLLDRAALRLEQAALKPYRLTSPSVGLSPRMPVSAAGWRMEPPVSLPSAAMASPEATAAADPPLEPPGTRSRPQGL